MSQPSNLHPIAAIDIGTNSAHLVIAEMDSKAVMRVIDTDKVTLRLGQAIDNNGNLTANGIFRTVEALTHMKEITNSYKAPIRAVATHATREAHNYRELLAAIRNATGIEVEVIDGVEEARLVFLGMRYGLPLAGISCLGVDIGGGSTEIIQAKDDEISYVASAKLGAVTLSKRFLDLKAPKGKQIESLANHVRSRLATYVPELKDLEFEKAIASSGTAKAVASIHSKLFTGESLSDTNGYRIRRDDINQIYKRLMDLKTPSKIKDATGIDAARAEIILPGIIILSELTNILKVDEWTVTTYGLREGLVADTHFRLNETNESNFDDVQWSSVRKFAVRLGISATHGDQMVKLVTKLHHDLAPIVRPQDHEIEMHHDCRLLQVASYLHNAGKFISAPQYHKHSNYLISNSQLPGFTNNERQTMGLITRFQRKSVPSAGNRHCSHLTPNDLNRLKLLAGIVRLASALDRTRQNKVNDVQVIEKNNELTFKICYTDQTPDVELHKARLEKEALERSFGLPVSFELVKKKR